MSLEHNFSHERKETLPVDVNVLVADSHMQEIKQVAIGVSEAGMKVTKTMEIIGVIYGSILERNIPNLYKVDGVETVESSRTIENINQLT